MPPGTNPGFNAPSVSGILARLPELTLALAKTEFLTGKLSFVGSDGKAIARTSLTVTLKDAAGNVVNVADNGSFKCYAEEYFYTISGKGVEYTTGLCHRHRGRHEPVLRHVDGHLRHRLGRQQQGRA